MLQLRQEYQANAEVDIATVEVERVTVRHHRGNDCMVAAGLFKLAHQAGHGCH